MRERKRREDEEYKQLHPDEVARQKEEKRRKLIAEFLPPEEP